MALFPFLAAPIKKPQSLPLLEEWAFDFDAGRLLVTDGQMHRVTGMDALNVWMYKALCTVRGRFAAYSASFGSELESLVGSAYSPAAVRTEARRMVTEALLVSPYIYSVSGVEAALEGGVLAIHCTVDTAYGSTSREVTV
jgi:hypothetical protein